MARGRPLPALELSGPERIQLQAWARSGKTTQALALRSHIVLACSRALSNHEVAHLFNVTPQTVGKWRHRFIEKRLDGLLDEPRSGAPRKLDDGEIAQLIDTALAGPAPFDAKRWSSRALAAQLGVSQSTVSRVLRGMGLAASGRGRRLPIDAHFGNTVRDVVGLYLDGPLRAVLCVDEERPQTAHPAASAPTLPGLPSVPEHTAGEPRHGGGPFEALGSGKGATGDAHGPKSRLFLAFMRAVDASVARHLQVHVIVDDGADRLRRPAIEKWLAGKPRFRLRRVASYGAWLGGLERWFRALADGPGESGDGMIELERALRAYLNPEAPSSGPFAWVRRPEAVPGLSESPHVRRTYDSRLIRFFGNKK